MISENEERTTLLIDNSNTRTKFRLDFGGHVGEEQRVIPTADITVEAVRDLLRGWRYGRACLCSVVPEAAGTLAAACGVALDSLGVHSPMNIELDYPGLATLGADRIANAMAAAEICPLPCVAVDAGTAVTFDVVVPGGCRARFIGGVIAPGLSVLGRCLSGNTALLPAVEPSGAGRVIGRSTAEALQAGALCGHRGLVREILQSIARELGEKPYVIATGGDAALLAGHLPEIDRVEPLLTFMGLSLAVKLDHRRAFLTNGKNKDCNCTRHALQ